MNEPLARFSERARDLKQAFDHAFAAPVLAKTDATEDLIEIGAGASSYCLRLSEITGLYNDKAITPLPGSPPTLLGIAGFRGAIVPIYSLAALLGGPGSDASRWLALVDSPRVALAFETFEGHLCIPAQALVRCTAGEDTHRHVRAMAHVGGSLKPVLDLPSILEAIKARAHELLSKRNITHVQ